MEGGRVGKGGVVVRGTTEEGNGDGRRREEGVEIMGNGECWRGE